jgi:threonylcarbamoyladenosine tRNA methylthiotransferase MtaB
MVGFPGETDTHFEETYTLLRESPLSYFHVFSYSERQNTRSVKLPDKVNAHTIAKRSQILRELSQRKRHAFYQNFIGKTLPILVEQSKKGNWVGVSEHYIKVRFKSELNLKNKIVPVKLQSIENDAMVGELV